MATTTTKTVTATVVRTGHTLTVSAKSDRRGVRTLEINLDPIDDTVTTEEHDGVLDRVMGAGTSLPWGTPYELELTIQDLKVLADVKAISERLLAATPAPIDRRTVETVVGATGRVVRPVADVPPAGDPARAEAARVAQARAVIGRLNEPQWLLQYDIPDSSDEGNPSWLMWRCGFFRLTKSVWVGPQSCTEDARIVSLMAAYREKGIRAYLIPFAESANAQLRQLAEERLRELLVEVHTSLVTRIASAAEFLAAGRLAMEKAARRGEEVTTRQQEALDDRYDGRMRSAIQVAAERLEVAIGFAEQYDHQEQVADLLQGLRAALRAEAVAFNANALAQDRRALVLPKAVA